MGLNLHVTKSTFLISCCTDLVNRTIVPLPKLHIWVKVISDHPDFSIRVECRLDFIFCKFCKIQTGSDSFANVDQLTTAESDAVSFGKKSNIKTLIISFLPSEWIR